MNRKYTNSFRKTASKLVYLPIALFVAVGSFLLFGKSEPVHALNTTYYVDSLNGSDTNDGLSEASAWQTYARAHSARNTLGAGDQILFKRGETYNVTANQSFHFSAANTSGADGNPITIGAYGSGDKPILDYAGSGTSHSFDFRTDSYITVQDLDIRGFNTTGIVAGNDSTNLTLRNLSITSTSSTSTGVNILTGVNESIKLISVIVQGVYQNGIQINTTTGLVIDSVSATNNGGNGIRVGSSVNVEISRVTSTGNDGHGIGIIYEDNNNYTVRDSILNNNGGNGLGIAGSGQNILVTNTIANNNFDGFNVHGSWTGIVFDRCTADENGTIGSETGADGDGYTFHDDSSGIIRYSTAKNNVKTAMAHVGDSHVEMYYNIFTHDTNGELALVYLGDSSANGTYTLANNVIYSAAQVGEGVAVVGYAEAAIHNNIVHGFDTGVRKAAVSTVNEDHNLVYGAATTAFSGTTPGSNSLEVDPMFVDTANENFRVTADSPAVDAGMTLAYTTDFAGQPVPQAGTTDIGAFEITPQPVAGSFTGPLENQHTLVTDTSIVYTVSNKSLQSLTSVAVNGILLSTDDYTAEQSGQGVAIGLLPAYLNTLMAGAHNLNLTFSDGTSVEAEFIVIQEDAPEDDTSGPVGGTDNANPSTPITNTDLADTGMSILVVAAVVAAMVLAGIFLKRAKF